MQKIITPEPHLIPGYSGHCPHFRFRTSVPYGRLTHKLLIDPCVRHAPELIVPPHTKVKVVQDSPTKYDIKTVEERGNMIDAVYRHPLMPGYMGFVPNRIHQIGQRYSTAATVSVAEHEHLMKLYRCKRRSLAQNDLICSSEGIFVHKTGARMMPNTAYRSPLTPIVNKRAQAPHLLDCSFKEKPLPYSKDTPPHFMECGDDEKYIIRGYAGHVPMLMGRFGETNRESTNAALCNFKKRYPNRMNWCDLSPAAEKPLCPNIGHFVIYHKTIGMVPKYSGHVPGEGFTFGRTYGQSTIDPKNWLEWNKEMEALAE